MSLAPMTIGVGLLAHAWFFLFPYVDRPDFEIGGLLLLGGAGAVLFGARGNWLREPIASSPQPSRLRAGATAVLCLIPCWLPWPFALPFVVLSAAACLDLLLQGNRVSSGLRLLGRVLALQAAILGLRLALTLELTNLPVLEDATACILSLLGLSATTGAGQALTQVGSGLRALTLTLESSGLLIIALMGLPLLVWGKAAGRIVALMGVFGALRLLGLCAWSSYRGGDATFFVDPQSVLLSFVPWWLIVLAYGWKSIEAPAQARVAPLWQLRTAAVGGFAVALLCTFAIGLVDHGETKGGRILVDDAHGPWEPSTMGNPLKDYGTDSIYNYSALWRFARHHYPVAFHTEGEISDELLAQTDILVLKTPSFAYSSEEINRIAKWVRSGGGLIAIGDHTNVFGTTSCLNAVIRPLGIEIETNVACIVNQRAIGNYRHRAFGLGPNPLTDSLDAVDFMGPASVRCTAGSPDHLMICGAQAMDAADYRDGSFFGDTDATIDDEIRTFSPLMARGVGQGRVAVFADSTIFSNFAMFEPGKPELIGSMLAYANRGNTSVTSLKQSLLPLVPWALVLLFAVVVLAPSRVQWIALASFGGGVVLVSAALRLRTPVDEFTWPEPTLDYCSVGFYTGPGGMDLAFPSSDDHLMEQMARTNEFSSLFMATLRCDGVFPRAVTSLEETEGLDALIIIDPETEPSEPELESLNRAVQQGLRLFVGGTGNKGFANTVPFLKRAGMALKMQAMPDVPIHKAIELPSQLFGATAPLLMPADAVLSLAGLDRSIGPGERLGPWGVSVATVTGGEPLWSIGHHSLANLARRRVGKGAIYAFAGAASLTNESLAGASDILYQGDPQLDRQVSWNRILILLRDGLVFGEKAEESAPSPVDEVSSSQMARDLLRKLQARTTTGSTRAELQAFAKNVDTGVFCAGYALEDDLRSEVWIAGDRGTIKGSERAPLAAYVNDAEASRWLPPTVPSSFRMPRVAGQPHSPLSIPAEWLEFEWNYRTTKEDPFGKFRTSEDGLAMSDLNEVLKRRLVNSSRMPTDGWVKEEPGSECAILSTTGAVHLGNGIHGTVELWIDLSRERIRKSVITARSRGRTWNGAWFSFLFLYGPYETNPAQLPPFTGTPGRSEIKATPSLTRRLVGELGSR